MIPAGLPVGWASRMIRVFKQKQGTVMYDYLIKGATIVDGLGGKPYAGDVAIRDGKIAAVGESEGGAKETIDAGGACVTPGWVDVHTHYDGQVSWDDTIEPSFSHGVTSVLDVISTPFESKR